MAQPYATGDMSAGPLDCSQGDNFELNTGYHNQEGLVAKVGSNWSHRIQRGNESYLADFVDYLGALPVLDTNTGFSHAGPNGANKCETLPTQLTLFYDGTVTVFENVTADKAKMIMSLAEGGNLSWQAMDMIGLTASVLKGPEAPLIQPSYNFDINMQKSSEKLHEDPRSVPIYSGRERMQVAEDGQKEKLAGLIVPFQAVVPKALPIARKESLARFLVKRRERVRMKAPYVLRGRQGVGSVDTCTQMSFNGAWTAGMRPLGFDTEFAGGKGASAECVWATSFVNSKQVSEGESAT